MDPQSHWRPSRYIALLIVGVSHLLLMIVFQSDFFSRRRQNAAHDDQSSTLFIVLPKIEMPAPKQPPPAPRDVQRAPDFARSPEKVAPTPPEEAKAPIDWEAELKRAGQSAALKEEEKAKRSEHFTPRKPGIAQPKPADDKDFSWSYRTHRVQSQDGMPIIWLSERCVLVAGLFPVCQLGKIKPRTDLFKDLRPEYLDESKLPPPKIDTLVGVTRYRLAMIANLLSQWHAEKTGYPADVAQLLTLVSAEVPMADRGRLLADAWSQRFIYAHPSRRPGCDYDLYSPGPDGRDDNGQQDDIATDGTGLSVGCQRK